MTPIGLAARLLHHDAPASPLPAIDRVRPRDLRDVPRPRAGRVYTEYAEPDGPVQCVTDVEDTGFLQQVLPLVRVTFAPAR